MPDPRTASSDLLPPAVPAARARSRQRSLTQLSCAAALVVPVALIAYRNAVRPQAPTLDELFLAPLLAGSALIFWMLFLHLIVCGDDIDVFGLRKRHLGLDVLLGIGLGTALLAFHFTFDPAVSRLFPPRPPVPQVLTLIGSVSRSPWMLALWLGPVVWIGVALFEELARVFLLRRVSLVVPGVTGRWTAIFVVSALVGLVHAYQGTAAVASIAVQSVLLGWVYFRTRSVRPLVVAHGLYDSVQIVMAVVAIRQMGA